MHTMHYHIGNCWQPLEILHDHHRRQSADSSPIASALESVLSDNTQRVYAAQSRLFNDWCADVGLRPLPASPSPWPDTWPPGLAPAPA